MILCFHVKAMNSLYLNLILLSIQLPINISSTLSMTSNSGDIIVTEPRVTEPRVRRQRLCGHCRQPGHDRRRCPDPVMVERRAAEEENRRLRWAAVVDTSRYDQEDTRKPYKIHNNNPYSVYLYWSKVGSDTVRFFVWLDDDSGAYSFLGLPDHRIIAFPTSEFTFTPIRGTTLKLSESDYFIAGDYTLGDYDDVGGNFHIIKEYEKPKTELEMWRECGLKSLFLLKEIERMGGKKNPNIEPILDMVQDITLPPHTEMDKELAGVPSVFTNLT
jgi:hypothetical protein